MNVRVMRLAAATAAMLTGAACGDGTGPKAGNLNLSLTGPVLARSAQFRVVGPQTGVTAGGANLRVFVTKLSGDTTMVAVIATVGHTLSESNIATFAVPDVGAAASYAITLLQVAAANYTLQNAALYAVTIQ
jgi:hypothetical protein